MAKNPKDLIGSRKVPWWLIPWQVIAEEALSFLEGAVKYGAFNFRSKQHPISAVEYCSATMRHLIAFMEGQDLDPNSPNQLSHITKARSSLGVLRDAMMNDNWIDDRPIRVANQNFIEDMNKKVVEVYDKFPIPAAPFTEKPLN